MKLKTDQLQGVLERFARLPRAWRLAAYPVIVALVGSAYGYALFLPARQELQAVQAKQFGLQRKLNEVRAVAANMGRFEEEIAALEKKFKIALRQLPDSKELPVLLTDVTSLGKNAGLEFKAFRPGDEVRRDFYAEVPIGIEFTGGFHEIATFFDRVAKLPRIVNVAELDMTIGKESAEATVLTVKGRATTFRFLEESNAPSAGAAPGKGKGKAGRKKKGKADDAGGAA
jgi:type IV pilus assembly protein PilO